MESIKCNECKNEISRLSKKCVNCNSPKEVISVREVSQLYTLLFGGLYFIFKGWYKAGVVALIITFLTGFIGMLLLPFIAKKLVDKLED